MALTTLTARGVLENGSLPVNFVPSSQTQHLAVGTDGRLVCNVVGSNGVAIDLTDCACVMSVKQSEDDLEPLIARLGTVTSAAGGIVEFTFSANDTIPLGAGSFVYDVVVTFPNNTTAQVVPTSPFILDSNPSAGAIEPTIQIPSQQGNSGKFLGTNGSAFQWQNVTTNLHWTGPWLSTTAYTVSDLASYGGGTYICIANVTDVTPPPADTAHWQLVVGAPLQGYSLQNALVAIDADTDLPVDSGGILVSSGDVTVTLPLLVDVANGTTYRFANGGEGVLTLTGDGSDTIGFLGQQTIVLPNKGQIVSLTAFATDGGSAWVPSDLYSPAVADGGLTLIAADVASTGTASLVPTAAGHSFNTSVGNGILNLPNANTVTGRSFYVFKASAANTVTIATSNGQTINGASSVAISGNQSCWVIRSTGTAWIVLSKSGT